MVSHRYRLFLLPSLKCQRYWKINFIELIHCSLCSCQDPSSQYTASLCLTSSPYVAGLVSHADLCLWPSCVLTRMATTPSFADSKRGKTAVSAGEIKGICRKCAQFCNSSFLKVFQKLLYAWRTSKKALKRICIPEEYFDKENSVIYSIFSQH